MRRQSISQVNINSAISGVSSRVKTFIQRNSDMFTMSLVFTGVLFSEHLTKYKQKTRNINNFASLHDI